MRLSTLRPTARSGLRRPLYLSASVALLVSGCGDEPATPADVGHRPDLTVVTGNKTLLTQWEVDAQAGLTKVIGTLYIFPYGSPIMNLDALSSLASVRGSLVIDNTTIPNLDALSSLTSVGRYLEVISNDALMSLDGLSGVTSVGEGLLVHRNAVLGSCSGIAGLVRSGGVSKRS